MICPKCNSSGVGKEVTRRGWSGDYACIQCGYNDAKSGFLNSNKETKPKLNLKLRAKPLV